MEALLMNMLSLIRGNCWALCTLLSTACLTGSEEREREHEVEATVSRNQIRNNDHFLNPLGQSATWSTAGFVDLSNDFFLEFGTNDRTCGHCHKPGEGWTISAASTRKLFDATAGMDPLFRTNDGSNSPTADVSTLEARRAAYSLLLARGVIRIGLGVPPEAEFELIAIDDPYGYASPTELSLFRRPLPAANLTLTSVVMWDGRVTGETLDHAFAIQANDATQGHAQAPDPLSESVLDSMVDFETGLFNAQLILQDAGRLDVDGGRGGAEALATQAFVVGRFNLFDAFALSKNDVRRAIYRGQELFNTRTRPSGGTCRTCHSAENIGTSANGRFFDIQVSDGSRRRADVPLYTFRRISTGEVITTTDPGRALVTGAWSDMNRFKTPSMRGLAARAPYFHDGSAATLGELVTFYEQALGFDFTAAEEADLVAFMAAL